MVKLKILKQILENLAYHIEITDFKENYLKSIVSTSGVLSIKKILPYFIARTLMVKMKEEDFSTNDNFDEENVHSKHFDAHYKPSNQDFSLQVNANKGDCDIHGFLEYEGTKICSFNVNSREAKKAVKRYNHTSSEILTMVLMNELH